MGRDYKPDKKAEILRMHYIEGVSISRLCKKYNIAESLFEKWKANLFENSDLVFKQIPDDGMDYYQNFDIVINWLSQAFKGHTLNVLGIETAPIKRVCSHKPVEIIVQTGVIDVNFEDENGKCYHLEEQRNMTLSDLYRFAIQHFSIAKEWQNNVVDIILISGTSYKGTRQISTPSGTYSPIFIDLTKRNGKKRLEEIRHEVEAGNMSSVLELVFIPMYGTDNEDEKVSLIKEVIRFEIELLKQDIVKEIILASTLIISNKLIDQQTFEELWEEIKMVNVLQFATNKGYEKGEQDGYNKGEIKTAIAMVLEALEESIGVVPEYLQTQINTISNYKVLKGLLRQAIKCRDIDSFNQKLALVS